MESKLQNIMSLSIVSSNSLLRTLIILYFCFIFPIQNIFTQTVQQDSIKTERLYIVGGVTLGAFIYGYGLQNSMWWKNSPSKFHFNWQDDWDYAMGADKVGHLFFGNLVANNYKHAFKWIGFNDYNSVLYSGIFSLSYQTFLEIRDGFSKNYGFSWGDFFANTFGSMYPLLQHKISELKNFNFKISYYPSERFKNGSNKYILDDYESTYHWLSVNVNNYLPKEVEKYFPDFINIAIGHSVKNLDTKDEHEFYLGLDWNFEALPGKNNFWIFLKELLNKYHFPAPTVKLYPNVVWYGLKF